MTPAQALCPFAAYYDSSRKTYWITDNSDNWIEITETSLRRHLRAAGVSTEVAKDDLVSDLDARLNSTQLESGVAFAGPLAGYSKGIHDHCGMKILVTSSPKLIDPIEGKFPILESFITNLLGAQSCYLFGWLKIAMESLRSKSIRPGQAMTVAGPRNCGKSLLQNIITILLGGRAAKPYRYMSGMTQFNGDLFGSEHLMIEDECGSTDLRIRREFGTRIKDMTVNEVQSCHHKNRQAFSMRPFWRLSISLNDEPENLMILPPIDESLTDKIILLKATSADMPMETKSLHGREHFWSEISKEFPAFAYFLSDWTIPDELSCPRFGIVSYQHPDLLAAIDALSPEIRLMALIDAVLFKESGDSTLFPVELSASSLESKLVNSDLSYEARRLLSWANACGTYLGRLAAKQPERISFHRESLARTWTIQPPTVKNGWK